MSHVKSQPPPKEGERPVWEKVFIDMQERKLDGEKKYGTQLKTHNGRDALVDAYQEALDLVVYLAQAIMERDGETQ